MSSIFSRMIPLFDRVLIERIIPETKTKAGLFIPENSNAIKSIQGRVIAVGTGARNQDGSVAKMEVKVGDTVLLPEFGGTKITLEDKELHMFREHELIAKLE